MYLLKFTYYGGGRRGERGKEEGRGRAKRARRFREKWEGGGGVKRAWGALGRANYYKTSTTPLAIFEHFSK